MMETISTVHFGKIIMKSYSTSFCDPTQTSDKTEFYRNVRKIVLYLIGFLMFFGLQFLISLLKSCFIIKNDFKLKVLKVMAQLLIVFMIIVLVCCAIYELISFLSFNKNFKTLLLNLM